MIAKIDHVAVGADAEATTTTLAPIRELGYIEVFRETDIPNPDCKRAYSSTHGALHDVVFLSAPRSLNLEVIAHGRTSGYAGYLRPIIRVPAGGSGVIHAGDFSPGWRPSSLGPAGLEAYLVEGNGRAPEVMELVYTSSDPEKSAAFWTALGFRPVDSDDCSATRVAFRSPLHLEDVQLRIVEGRPLHPPRLDDAGFNCIAFITTDLLDDARKVRDRGGKTSDAAELILNGRALTICFGNGPSGELFELVEVKRP